MHWGTRERMRWVLWRGIADANPDVCLPNLAFQLVVAPPANPILIRIHGRAAQQLRKRGATTNANRYKTAQHAIRLIPP